jgi:cell wall-associated NlpC family hydrolase
VTSIEDVLTRALTMWGREYEFGHEIGVGKRHPEEADCSELVEWACAMSGVRPIVPDGAYFQWVHCGNHGTRISVADGIDRRGALLFQGDGIGFGRDAIHHVAFSLGDGTTIEARGEAWGIGVFSTAGRPWTFAGLIPASSTARRRRSRGSSGCSSSAWRATT